MSTRIELTETVRKVVLGAHSDAMSLLDEARRLMGEPEPQSLRLAALAAENAAGAIEKLYQLERRMFDALDAAT